jgi:serine/threonine protein kinase
LDPHFENITFHRFAAFVDNHPATKFLDPYSIDMELVDLVFRCLSFNPRHRPTITNLRNFNYVTSAAEEVTLVMI